MRYRELGKTGLKLSEIGLGCEGFVEGSEAFTQELFELALKNGVNCMDVYSPKPELHRRIGKAIRGGRKDFVLQGHLCTRWQDGQYGVTRKLDEVKSSFEAMLENYGTDYIDLGMIHYVDSMETWKQVLDGGALSYAKEQKKLGHIHHIGFSSHNPEVALECLKSGEFEVVLFSVNPCYDLLPGYENCESLWSGKSYDKPLVNFDPKRVEFYETCQSMGVGITVMKAFGGGDLLSDKYSPAGKALSALQCIHYALTRPAVISVMAGVRSREDLEKALYYEAASEEERDYAAAFASFPKISWQGHCMYCGHCAPCPKGIDVATLTKFLNLAKAQGFVPETVREHYAALKATAADCIECHACEKRCPFGVEITANMREAKEIFGK